MPENSEPVFDKPVDYLEVLGDQSKKKKRSFLMIGGSTLLGLIVFGIIASLIQGSRVEKSSPVAGSETSIEGGSNLNQSSSISGELEYTVIKDFAYGRNKKRGSFKNGIFVLKKSTRYINVRIQREATVKELYALGRKLKKTDPNGYEKIFIHYYLPSMTVGIDEAWATSHLNPFIKVRMAHKLRSTLSTSFATAREDDEVGTLIAVWDFDPKESYWLSTKNSCLPELWLYNGKYQLKNIRFHYRTTMPKYVVSSENNKRFDIIDANKGEHYIINAKGNLEVWIDGSEKDTFIRQ